MKLAFTLLMALATIVGLMVMFAIIVGAAGRDRGRRAAGRGYHLVRILRWPLMLGKSLVLAALGLMYRFAPSPRPLAKRDIWPGAGIATQPCSCSCRGRCRCGSITSRRTRRSTAPSVAYSIS